MAKKKYVKPVMVTEEFVPNEYVAACAWEVGTDLSASCSGATITIELVQNQGGDVWTASPANENGTIDSSIGGQGMLYPIAGQPGTYGFGGAIYSGHSTSVNGEYYPASQIQDGKAGDSYGGGTLCDCVLNTQTGQSVGSWHHHLTNVRSKNHS